jgi:hypothetical protein
MGTWNSRRRIISFVTCCCICQIDLFAGEPQKAIGNMPAWSGLPTETQAALTSLMMRLLLEHADKSRISPDDGGRS